MKVEVIDIRTGESSRMDSVYARIFAKLGRVRLASTPRRPGSNPPPPTGDKPAPPPNPPSKAKKRDKTTSK